MDRLWGTTRPVPEEQLAVLENGDTLSIGGVDVTALETPGHASHHHAYAVGDVLFTGDVGGVRLPGKTYVELPLAPPEVRLDLWRESLLRIRTAVQHHDITHLAPTHFGVFDDVTSHLDRLLAALEAADAWVHRTLPEVTDNTDALQDAVSAWMREQATANGIDDETWELYELANPSWMAALGLRRYWEKHKAPSSS